MFHNEICTYVYVSQQKPKPSWECTKRATATPSPTSAVAPTAQVDEDPAGAAGAFEECNKLVAAPTSATAATTTSAVAAAVTATAAVAVSATTTTGTAVAADVAGVNVSFS